MAKQTNFYTNWNDNNKSKSVLLDEFIRLLFQKNQQDISLSNEYQSLAIYQALKHNLQYLQFSNLVRPKGSEPKRALD